MFADSSEMIFIVEVESEDARMIVSSQCFVAILSACVVSEWPLQFAETLEELLEVWFVQTAIGWQVFVVVGES